MSVGSGGGNQKTVLGCEMLTAGNDSMYLTDQIGS